MSCALIVTDLLTTYDFEDADPLAQSVEQALPAVLTLLRRAKEAGARSSTSTTTTATGTPRRRSCCAGAWRVGGPTSSSPSDRRAKRRL